MSVDGTAQAQLDTLAFPTQPMASVMPGSTWTFQGWYRDQNPSSTSNFTDAVRVLFE